MDISYADKLIELVESRYTSENKVNSYKRYILYLESKGLPPILSFRHLADLLEVDSKTLYRLCFSQKYFYRSFKIPKKSGGDRKVCAPNELMDYVQRWILVNILDRLNFEPPMNVVGYVRNKTIKDHLEPHLTSEVLIKFDIKDFFPSITTEDIQYMFEGFGYSTRVSKTFANLLTLRGQLPQGAPTSPFLSNLYMDDFDRELINYTQSKNLIYTRYVDDIVVSGSSDLLDMLQQIKKIFTSNRLLLNHAKTRVYKNSSEVRFVTGLALKDGSVRLPKAMRRKFRMQAHVFLSQLNRVSDRNLTNSNLFRKDNFNDPLFFERIIGKLNYWLFIEPNNEYALNAKQDIYRRFSDTRE